MFHVKRETEATFVLPFRVILERSLRSQGSRIFFGAGLGSIAERA